jgi:hypothetical protein
MLGSNICSMLRDIYFRDKPWAECYKDVSMKFTYLKTAARKFYANNDETEMLSFLSQYSREDLREMLEPGNVS